MYILYESILMSALNEKNIYKKIEESKGEFKVKSLYI